MFDLPTDFDPQVFVGAHLQKVAFGIGTIHLEFELNPKPTPGNLRPASIVSLSSITLQSGATTRIITVGKYQDIAELGTLLNESVSAALLTGERSFRLHFGEGRWLELADDGAGYESYHVSLPGIDPIFV